MAEPADSDSPLSHPSEDMHWGLSYLREDIQDVRQELRGQIQELRGQIHELRQDLGGQIQGQIQEVRQDLGGQIQGLRQESRQDTVNLQAQINSRFAWAIMTMIGLAGVIVAVVKV